MEKKFCPNYSDCKLVQTNLVIIDNAILKEAYEKKYCNDPEEVWESCKRYLTKLQLNFCPDFVLPDTTLTIDEIMDKFDEEAFSDN